MAKPGNTLIFESTLKSTQEWIRSADQKISIFLAFQGLVLTILTQKIIEWTNRNFITLTSLNLFLILTGLTLIGLSIAKSTFALIPRLKRKTTKKSLIFFGDIASISFNEFSKEMLNLSLTEYHKDLLEQIYTSSKISSAKHTHFKDAVYLFFIGTTLLFISYIYFWIGKIYGGY